MLKEIWKDTALLKKKADWPEREVIRKQTKNELIC